jgi:disulfide bond formation protein DsbB
MSRMALALRLFTDVADPVRRWLALILVVSLGALAIALAGQFLLGLRPCILCLYARIPYGIVALISGLGLILPLSDGQRRCLVAVVGLIFAAGAALAVYQVGVEEAWWASTIPGCAGKPVGEINLSDLQAGLFEPVRACTDVDFRLAGLTLAGWNGLVSAALTAGCLALVRRWPGKAPQ